MKLVLTVLTLTAAILLPYSGFSQVNVPLPGRVINKLLPDYGRPKVYALNKANGSVPGTLLALNSTNGAILGEITLNLNPTDMTLTPGRRFVVCDSRRQSHHLESGPGNLYRCC